MAARFTSFLVKVASRCNLDCDYCYVYRHTDQSWRHLPKVITESSIAAFAARLSAYLAAECIQRCVVIFHGGEPLLAGWKNLIGYAERIRAAIPNRHIDFGLQTNGLLLSAEAVRAFADSSIAVSLSLDGPEAANDRHRRTHKGRSSFRAVQNALDLLRSSPSVFAGVIAVIDADVAPDEVLGFFNEISPPKLDLLLPDANHLCPPPGSLLSRNRYEKWLIEAFDLWIDRYPELRIRTFEALLDSIAGLASGTDAFGLGDVSLLTIETDGTYHDLDVLKITKAGGTRLMGSVHDLDIAAVAACEAVARHRRLLRMEGLSSQCVRCPEVSVCGGGSVPHRYGRDGFEQPSVYCAELLALIRHARRRLQGEISGPSSSAKPLVVDFALSDFEKAECSLPTMTRLRSAAIDSQSRKLSSVVQQLADAEQHVETVERFLQLPEPQRKEIAGRPGTVAWCRCMSSPTGSSFAVDGTPLEADGHYLEFLLATVSGMSLEIASEDPWLRLPFGSAIRFETPSVVSEARPLAADAMDIIRAWRPALMEEIKLACSSIQFVQDPKAHPEKIVSFSDDSVPGALFISVRQGERLVNRYDLADSIIHEHRHQKLYLLERMVQLIEPNDLQVESPWREDLRPPSGLLHAIFVFTELRRFWSHVFDVGPSEIRPRARAQILDSDDRLARAFNTLDSCPLTPAGRQLADVLKSECSATLVPA